MILWVTVTCLTPNETLRRLHNYQVTAYKDITATTTLIINLRNWNQLKLFEELEILTEKKKGKTALWTLKLFLIM